VTCGWLLARPAEGSGGRSQVTRGEDTTTLATGDCGHTDQGHDHRLPGVSRAVGRSGQSARDLQRASSAISMKKPVSKKRAGTRRTKIAPDEIRPEYDF
jgi:hypothetical protein